MSTLDMSDKTSLIAVAEIQNPRLKRWYHILGAIPDGFNSVIKSMHKRVQSAICGSTAATSYQDSRTELIETQLASLPLVKQVRNLRKIISEDTGTSARGIDSSSPIGPFTEARVYATSPGKHSLIGSTLRGPGRITTAPLIFTSLDLKHSIWIVHLGSEVCGHEGIVHGGLLAALLDDSLARTAMLNLNTGLCVTSMLNIRYRAPTLADQFVVVRVKLQEQRSRSVTVGGQVETAEGQLLVEADAQFVKPKDVAFLAQSRIQDHIDVGH